MKKLVLALTSALALSANVYADSTQDFESKSIVVTEAFPAMKYISGVDDDINFDLLIKDPLLENLEKDLHGSPFLFASFIQNSSTEGGQVSQFTTGLLSATTLGLVPVVTNNDLTIHYRIRLQQTTISEFTYSKNFTDAGFLWAGPDQELSTEVKAWVKSTVPMFLRDVRRDEKLKEMIDEYQYYFGEES
ncbi:hypothetical protein [Thalassotalea sp. PS06]|uniref:hypothetical protein n=1 Tax=Thalassotalea sp. PS06 TaxID=2594005 RepID=UPI001164FA53|nr:hypothetical protein [Thalassotalea sp. PS06]QDP02719.1 hypothetical protein FNC98_16035 [Thalassotalea sp. PS06]